MADYLMNSSKAHMAVILLVTVASLLLIPLVIDALASRSLMAERRARVAAMSDAEISRLEINFDKYKRLKSESPAELARLERIHIQLAQQPELVATAVQYREWLNSLESWQQDVIREISEPDERYQYVSRMLDRKFIRLEPKWGPLAEAFPDGIQVSSEDVEAMSQHLKEGICKVYFVDRSQEYQRISSLPDNQRDDERRKLMRKYEQMRRGFDELLTTTVELIADAKIATLVNKDPRQKAWLVAALLKEHEKRKSPEAEFQTVFASLSPERQDAIMQMTPEAAQIELRRASQVNKREPKDDFYYAFLAGNWMRRTGGEYRGSGFSRVRNGRPGRDGNRGPGGPGRGSGGAGSGGSSGRRSGSERGLDGQPPREKSRRPQRPRPDGK
jgi:hypothetical protein